MLFAKSRGFSSLSGGLYSRWMATKATSSLDGFNFPGPRALRNIAKLPLLDKESPERVSEIWKLHHAELKTAIGDVLTPSQYGTLMQRAQRCPLFVLPVYNTKRTGHFMVFVQWQDKHCLITYLDDYKRLGGAAAPYMIVSLFDDLVKTKDVALVRGEVFTDRLSKSDSSKLLVDLKKWYLGAERNYDLLIRFNERPVSY
mmetsp:Transcript_22105/g.89589  ORF Transcript_22105/g.89589 Transcript_22105/m.89589 type:complete len:200 (-) Transcript_22105:582-1181(-)